MIEQTLGQLLEEGVAQYPDKEFMVYSDRNLRFTYKTFNQRVDNIAKGLLSIGMKKGDHLGIWATNVPDWLTYAFASAKIGVVMVTINTNYKKHELEYLVKNADIHTLCIIEGWRDSNYVAIVNELIPELKTCERGHLKSKRFPELRNLVFLGPEKHRGMYNTPELLLLGKYVEDDALTRIKNSLNCHEVINMQYTSGTTGFPKGVMLSHYNITNNGFWIGECQRFTSNEKLCLPPPLFHCFGIVLGVMAILTHKATLVMIENFDALLVLASIQKEKCTALYGVPTMFIAELHHPMFDMFDLSSLRTGIMAGSPCPLETMKQVIDKMHMTDITIAYGLTEASPVMTQTRIEDPIEKKVSSVGKELPHIEVKVVHPDTGEECAVGEQGELVCRGYNIMKGYYKDPEATNATIDDKGWLHSGDLGVKDADGYYCITGRIKDMIIRGGENIYPREIEEFLLTMPEIQDIQVVGIDSPKYGEAVCAFIRPQKDCHLMEEDVREFCVGKIARFKIPKYILFVDEFPMTASGKIQKYKLTEMGNTMLKERGIEVI